MTCVPTKILRSNDNARNPASRPRHRGPIWRSAAPTITCGLLLGVMTACRPAVSESPLQPEAEPEQPAQTERTWESTIGLEHPLVGSAIDARTKHLVELADVLAEAGTRQLVLLGESHDNPDHHVLQAEFLSATASRRPLVVMEHLDPAHQADLDALLARETKATLAELSDTTRWEGSGWPAFSLFAPIFVVILDAKLSLEGALFPRAMAMSVATEGMAGIDAQLVARFKLDQSLPQAQQTALLDVLEEAHCGAMPREALTPMVDIQRVRDAMLADAMPETAVGVMIAGRGHVRRDRGAGSLLAERDTFVVAFVEVDDARTDPADYLEDSQPFDVIVFTPRTSDEDPCAAFAHGK